MGIETFEQIHELDLLENALDFLDEGVQMLLEPEPSSKHVKYAILHVASALELLLKQKLLEKDWKLLFSNTNQADQILFEKGDFHSVDLKKIKKRLSSECGIILTNEQDIILSRNKALRNEIMHFKMSVSHIEAVSIILKSWSFTLDFIQKYIDLSAAPDSEKMLEKIRDKMVNHQAFIETRSEEAREKVATLPNDATLIECPCCLEKFAYVSEDQSICLLCNRDFKKEDFPELWHSTFLDYKDQLENDISVCPECNFEGLLKYPDKSNEILCLYCGVKWDKDDFDSCDSCGRLILAHESPLCDSCEDSKFESF